MTDICNYKIILIDSKNVIYNGDSNLYDFHIRLSDNIRDVYKIKVLYDAISFPTTNLLDISTYTSKPLNLDNVYINLNDYDRVKSSIIVANQIIDIRAFDSIMIDFNKIKTGTGVSETTMYNDFNENEGDYYLQPIEANFNRINIKLIDKNNNIILKSHISRFVMKLCIYYNTKKISQF